LPQICVGASLFAYLHSRCTVTIPFAMAMQNADIRNCVANFLPPAFIATVVGVIWSTYACLHLLPMLQFHTPAQCFEYSVAIVQPFQCRALWETVISQMLTGLLVVCFARAVLESPGSVPNTFEWKLGGDDHDLPCHEAKESGERRHCKWCLTYKPDRCHHCRICGSCVLRMDHHCPWIMNCVGFGNQKYFFLLVIYAVLNCNFIAITIMESVIRSVNQETLPGDRFLLVLGLVVAMIMGVLTTCFLSFHVWLMMRNMTTIEFCEKTMSGDRNVRKTHSYNLGAQGNFRAVLGDNPLFWFLPMSPPSGDGVHFPSSDDADGDPEWTEKPGKIQIG